MYRILPNLKFLPIDELDFHERPNEIRVERLIAQVKQQGVLKNPIVAARMSSTERLLVLDGITRVKALKKLGCRDVAAQIVQYDDPAIRAGSNCWVIESVTRSLLVNRFGSIGLFWYSAPFGEGMKKIKSKAAACYLLFRDGNGVVVPAKTGALRERIELIRIVSESLSDIFEIHTVNKPENFPILFRQFDKGNAVVVMPEFTKSEIIAARRLPGCYFPFGVTTHIVPERVLGLSIPLSILASDDPVSDKNAYLHQIMKLRFTKRRARYYPESVLIFND